MSTPTATFSEDSDGYTPPEGYSDPSPTRPTPDPTVLTRRSLAREIGGLERELELRQDMRDREHSALQELLQMQVAANTRLVDERVASLTRQVDANEKHRLDMKVEAEAHRLELKADGEKALTTALTAAEKAVGAALAAAEKARDQQTIASQLATTKAEEGAKDAMKLQGETFSAAIKSLDSGLGDVKGLLGELRAEKRGGMEQVTEHRVSTGQMIAIASFAVLLGGLIVALVNMLLGG